VVRNVFGNDGVSIERGVALAMELVISEVRIIRARPDGPLHLLMQVILAPNFYFKFYHVP
jgi:hypothetical protein